MKHEVYDDRTNEVLFVHESSFVCVSFIASKVAEKGEWYGAHLWIRAHK